MTASSYPPMILSPHDLVDSLSPNRSMRSLDRTSVHSTRVRQVVACLDGSDLGRGVVPHAQLISKALGARLTLLHVLESEPGSGVSSIPANPLEWGIREREARCHLDRAVSESSTAASEIGAELIQGRPAEQICHWAENHDVDLTVLCSHGSQGVTEWGLASTARKLIDRVRGSVLLVPAAVASASEDVEYRRIVVPLDSSMRAESVLPLAMRIAESQIAEVVLVHIVTKPEIFRLGLPDAESIELEQRVVEHNERVATAYLDQLRARVGRSGVRVRSRVLTNGNVRESLQKVIQDEQADLVVMSAHGTTGQLEAPFGSVAEYALTHASTPLLMLRERDHGHLRRRLARRSVPPPDRFDHAGLAIS